MLWNEALYVWLIHSAIVSLLVLAIGSGAILLSPRPARRVWIIELTLAGCLIAPWLGVIPGYPRLGVAWQTVTRLDQSVIPLLPSAARAGKPVLPSSDNLPLPSHIVPFNASTESVNTREIAFDFASSLVAVYGLGVVLGLGWWLVGIVGLARLVWTARPAPRHCEELLAEISGRRANRVGLLVGRRVRQPFACVLRRPLIVLPEDVTSNEQSLRWCLAHEYAHIEHHDFRAWLLASLARMLFFYNPLVWWLQRQLRLCQDYVADAQAARQSPSPEDYAAFLTARAASGSLRPAIIGVGIGFHVSELYRRVIMLVQNEPVESRAPRLWCMAASMAALVLVTAVAALFVGPQAAATDQPAAPVQTASVAGEAKPAHAEPVRKPAAESFKAKLPNGTEVEIVGIGEPPKGVDEVTRHWWRPDGRAMTKNLPPGMYGGIVYQQHFQKGQIAREVSLEFRQAPGSESRDRETGPWANFDADKEVNMYGAMGAEGGSMLVYLSKDVKQTNMQIALASRPWETRGVIDSASGGKAGEILVSRGTEVDGGAAVTLSYLVKTDHQIAVMAQLRGSNESKKLKPATVAGGEATGGNAGDLVQTTYQFPNVPLKQVELFIIWERPYAWVEFQNVSLYPGHKTQVKTLTAVPSPFSKGQSTGNRTR